MELARLQKRLTLYIIAHALIVPLFLSVIYLAAWRASSFLGHWPRMGVEAPEYLVRRDDTFEKLYEGTKVLGLFAMNFVPLGLLFLTFCIRSRRALIAWILGWASYALFWIVIACEPTDTITWWLV